MPPCALDKAHKMSLVDGRSQHALRGGGKEEGEGKGRGERGRGRGGRGERERGGGRREEIDRENPLKIPQGNKHSHQ